MHSSDFISPDPILLVYGGSVYVPVVSGRAASLNYFIYLLHLCFSRSFEGMRQKASFGGKAQTNGKRAQRRHTQKGPF